MLRKVLALFRPEAQHGLVMVLEKVGGGVHKRVDENRELVELLRKKAPALLQEFPWAEDWLRSNDEVFTAFGRQCWQRKDGRRGSCSALGVDLAGMQAHVRRGHGEPGRGQRVLHDGTRLGGLRGAGGRGSRPFSPHGSGG